MFTALYLHLPFCVRRCRYCDFATAATRRDDPLVAAYTDALANLAQRLGAAGLLQDVRTVYVGGGTPTLAGPHLAQLARAVRSACEAGRQSASVAEFSTEANPESLDANLVRELAAAGITRVSLGVQSLDDRELARLGRAHSAQQALDAARSVANADLDLSCDLMCGIPLQTASSWQASLAGVLAAGAGHVSCYPLAIEDGTPLAVAIDAGEEHEPDDDLQADLMLAAARTLEAAGLCRYEVASYARPGKECRHNIAYWTGAPYLGLGSSAASMMSPKELLALAEALPLAVVDAEKSEGFSAASMPGSGEAPTAYLARHPDAARARLRLLDPAASLVGKLAGGESLLLEAETLTAREAAAEDLMLALRMTRGVSSGLRERAVAAGIPLAELDRTCALAVERGLASWDADGSLVPTQCGWLLGNELYGAFWDLAEQTT